MTYKEKVKILLKYFGTNEGNIDLSHIDFGNRVVFNNSQKANKIYNTDQEANEIYNNSQEANKIHNHWQRAYEIDNNNQSIKIKYEDMSKEELIKEIRKLKEEKE